MDRFCNYHRRRHARGIDRQSANHRSPPPGSSATVRRGCAEKWPRRHLSETDTDFKLTQVQPMVSQGILLQHGHDCRAVAKGHRTHLGHISATMLINWPVTSAAMTAIAATKAPGTRSSPIFDYALLAPEPAPGESDFTCPVREKAGTANYGTNKCA